MRAGLLLLMLLGVALASGCVQSGDAPPTTPTLTWLRVGLLPTQDRERLLENTTPLVEFISHELGIPYRILMAEDYLDAQRLFGAEMVDLANFGGMGFIQAQREFGARPLAMREVDTRFTSLFLARTGEGDEVTDFRNKGFAFGSEHSTSGHFMPRYFLKTILEIQPESHFDRIQYAPRHDQTARMVQSGEVDLGVADAVVVRAMFEDGRLDRDKVNVVWETPTYPNHVWSVPSAMPEADRRMLLHAFLKLSWEEEGHRAILERLGTRGFLPASTSDFAMLVQVEEALKVAP